jgi:hypothetical protein
MGLVVVARFELGQNAWGRSSNPAGLERERLSGELAKGIEGEGPHALREGTVV